MKTVDFFQEIGKMKKIKRRGWVIEGVKDPESIAEHSFRTALMALILGNEKKDIDLFKTVRMALIHDVAESKTGDIVVDRKRKYGKHAPREMFDRMTDEEKHEREKNAFKELTDMLGKQGQGYFELWKELEEGKTTEARFVKQVDKLEMSLQAMEYMLEDSSMRDKLMNYFVYTRERLKDPELIKILNKMESRVHKK